jgi:hypothetical protein
MNLSRGIAFAAVLAHELYGETSTAMWYFMTFRVVELYNRVKAIFTEESTQTVVLICFQIAARHYDPKAELTPNTFWYQATERMGMNPCHFKTDVELAKLHARVLEALGNATKPVDGPGSFPMEGCETKIRFNEAQQFFAATAHAPGNIDPTPPRTLCDGLTISMQR